MWALSATKTKLLTDVIGGFGMGVGYTSGAYGGYGIANTLDPIGIHAVKPSYTRPQYGNIELAYGYRPYRRRYRSYWRYRRYRRRSYYRRRYY